MGRFSNLEFSGDSREREEERAVPAESRDERFYLRQADGLYRSARFEKALRGYSRALEHDPNLFPAWLGQVQMLIELGERKEARLWAEKGMEIHRDHPDLLSAKSVALARSGDPEQALAFSDAAMAQKGATPYVWTARGEALLASARGNHEPCFLKADEAARGDWFPALCIGRVEHLYGHHAQAQGWARKALDRACREPFAWHLLGDCQREMGLEAQAGASYGQALSLDPDFPLSKKALARLHSRSLLDRAADWLSRALGRRR